MTEDAATSEVAKSWEDLAVALGISSRMLSYDRKIPGAPKSKSIDAWRTWRGRKRPGTLPADSDPASDTLGERRIREEIRALQLTNDGKEKRHQLEAQRAAEEVNDQLVAKIRTALLGAFPGKLAEAVQGKTADQVEALTRVRLEELLRSLK